MQQLKFDVEAYEQSHNIRINEIKISQLTKSFFKDSKLLKVISLFCGCGGMDLGFRGGFSVFDKIYDYNPFDIVFANDIEEHVTTTYNHNFGHKPLCKDINDINFSSLPEADIVIGGFPCQDFSHAGKRLGLDAKRGRLYKQMSRVIAHVQPAAFIAENVDGLRTIGKNESALNAILTEFEDLGYKVQYSILNAADFGVPQTRKRIIIVGLRNDISKTVYFPAQEFSETGFQNRWMSAKEGIDDLWEAIGNSKFANHSLRDYSKAKFYPGKRMQGNNKIKPDVPSPTIRAEHHGNIEAHYRTYNDNDPDNMQHWRRLSVRECARLQSFPDGFIFPVSASRAYKQIGNAVPPIMAWHIARALYYSLNS